MSCSCENILTGVAAVNAGNTAVDITIPATVLPTVNTRYKVKIAGGIPTAGYGLPVALINGTGTAIPFLSQPLAEIVYGYQVSCAKCTDSAGNLWISVVYVPSNTHFSVCRRLPNQ